MKSIGAKLIWSIIILLTFSEAKSQQHFSKKELLEELSFLKSSLEDAHYNLYAYTSKQDFETNYQEVKESIQADSFSLLEATSILQRVVSKANVGHTWINFPIPSYGAYADAGGTLFPLEIAFEDNKPLIRKNWSGNDSISIGTELLSINGMSIEEILSRIYPQLSAERLYFKQAKVELYSLPRLYWQLFGEQKKFEVTVRIDNSVQHFKITSVKAIEGYEMQRTPVLNASMQLKLFHQTAYLNPGNFSGDMQKYQAFIDSAFRVINNKACDNLILDFRNNQGGDEPFSNYLVSYIANKPFKWCSEFSLKTSAFLKKHTRQKSDTTTKYSKQILAHKDGEIYNYEFGEYQPQPIEKRFSGKVYVLINRQSHSQSTVAAAQIKDYGFGTIVGEETGEYPTLYAAIFQYALPKTGIIVNIAKGRIVRVNGSTKEKGVIPDIFIKDYLLDETDEILDGLLQQINDSK